MLYSRLKRNTRRWYKYCFSGFIFLYHLCSICTLHDTFFPCAIILHASCNFQVPFVLYSHILQTTPQILHAVILTPLLHFMFSLLFKNYKGIFPAFIRQYPFSFKLFCDNVSPKIFMLNEFDLCLAF